MFRFTAYWTRSIHQSSTSFMSGMLQSLTEKLQKNCRMSRTRKWSTSHKCYEVFKDAVRRPSNKLFSSDWIWSTFTIDLSRRTCGQNRTQLLCVITSTDAQCLHEYGLASVWIQTWRFSSVFILNSFQCQWYGLLLLRTHIIYAAVSGRYWNATERWVVFNCYNHHTVRDVEFRLKKHGAGKDGMSVYKSHDVSWTRCFWSLPESRWPLQLPVSHQTVCEFHKFRHSKWTWLWVYIDIFWLRPTNWAVKHLPASSGDTCSPT